jgi:hypothetical protein
LVSPSDFAALSHLPRPKSRGRTKKGHSGLSLADD